MWLSFADNDTPTDPGSAEGDPQEQAGPQPTRSASPETSASKSAPPPAPRGEPDDNERTVADEINATLMGLLPWGVSILLHVGLFLLAFFVAWSTYTEPDEDAIVTPQISGPVARQPVQTQTQRTTQVTRERSTQPTEVQTNEPAFEEVSPTGESALVDLPPPQDPSPLEEIELEEQENQVSIVGVRGSARKIAFLIDASGSLIDSLPHVTRYLRETTIPQLNSQQEFTVIFFKGDDVVEIPPRGLKRATPENKQSSLAWLRNNPIIPERGTDPVNAIRRALNYRPQLLFILSDNLTNAGAGPYEVPQWKLIEEIKRANIGNTKIKTIQFIYPDPLDQLPGREGTMKKIARLFGAGPGGQDLNQWYTFIDERDLNIE